MNRIGKTVVATAVPVALALLLGGAEIANYHYNDSLDPRAPYVRSKLTGLMNKDGMDSVNTVNSAVKDFYTNNGEGTLLAIQQGNDFAFVYYKKGDQSEEYKNRRLAAKYKNWGAARKYMEIVTDLEKANEKVNKATEAVSEAKTSYDQACADLKQKTTPRDIAYAKGSLAYCKDSLETKKEILTRAEGELRKLPKVVLISGFTVD